MRFDVVTIFPRMFDPFFATGVIGRAQVRGLLCLQAHDLRDYAEDHHRKVDDAPFGGGAGMVLKPGPIFRAVEAVRRINSGPVVLLEPWGERFDQGLARELSQAQGLILVCGRYEGIDDRVRAGLGAREISIGDYVLSGGEVPAMVVIDAVARLRPGVLGDETSLTQDSFGEGVADTGDLLGYPQYTRPVEYRGLTVPEVLLSGDHARIRAWRRQQSLARTATRAKRLRG